MRRLLLALCCALALASAALPAAAAPARIAPLHRTSGEAIPGAYIVVLEEGRSAAGVASELGIQARHTFAHALDGFAAVLDDRRLEAVRRHPHVAFVEEDQVVAATGVQSNPPWNLDRIDQRYRPLDYRYRWNYDGSGVHAYVIDTGIQTGHWDFGGRAHVAFDALGGNGQDCNGHGTHVAGIVGGRTFGVAKGVTLWSVRVLNCSGSGTISGVIAGTDWVRVNGRRPAVANYSLGGSSSASLNAAVNNLAASGVFVTAASGSSTNPCNTSPAGASGAMGVGPTNTSDQRGAPGPSPCIEVWAPGASIVSAWLNGGTATLSGSSMAAPHAAGTGALVFANPGAWPPAPRNWITTHATTLSDGWGSFPFLYKGAL